MTSPAVLGFLGGVAVGLLLAWIWRIFVNPFLFPDPEITVQCAAGQVTINGNLPTIPSSTITFKQLHYQIYDNESTAAPDLPPETAGTKDTFPIEDIILPDGFSPPGLAVVWAEYHIFGRDSKVFNCTE
jgi:hypothetical protein